MGSWRGHHQVRQWIRAANFHAAMEDAVGIEQRVVRQTGGHSDHGV